MRVSPIARRARSHSTNLAKRGCEALPEGQGDLVDPLRGSPWSGIPKGQRDSRTVTNPFQVIDLITIPRSRVNHIAEGNGRFGHTFGMPPRSKCREATWPGASHHLLEGQQSAEGRFGRCFAPPPYWSLSTTARRAGIVDLPEFPRGIPNPSRYTPVRYRSMWMMRAKCQL